MKASPHTAQAFERLFQGDAVSTQFRELGDDPGIGHLQIFQSRGAMMGASNPHPHYQIWATRSLPEIPVRETDAQREYLRAHGKCLLCEYCRLEGDKICALWPRTLRSSQSMRLVWRAVSIISGPSG
jgi:galactose-1-phosphate uridylyltransferase